MSNRWLLLIAGLAACGSVGKTTHTPMLSTRALAQASDLPTKPSHATAQPAHATDAPEQSGADRTPESLATTSSSTMTLPPRADQAPPRSGGRITGEIVAGAAGAIAGIALGAIIGTGIGGDGGRGCCLPAGAALGGLIGLPLGMAAGVYAVGCLGNQTGSFGRTLGAAAGSLGAGVGLIMLERVEGPDFFVHAGLLLIVSSPIIATIAFNSSRRYEQQRGAPIGSLVRVDDGLASIGIPMPIQSNETTGFSLASGSF